MYTEVVKRATIPRWFSILERCFCSVVREYDEALAFYVGKLGFALVEDSCHPEQDKRPSDPEGIASKRWVTIRPPGAPANATTILLARAATDHQAHYIGDQTGGRVAFFLATDDFARDHARFTQAGVEWVRPPADELYGRVAVFADLYGNLWDLVQFAPGHHAASPPQ